MTRVIRPAAPPAGVYDDDEDDDRPVRSGRPQHRAHHDDEHQHMGLPMRAVALALAHPIPTLGIVASVGIVIAVAANAIGNQPGHHPSPFFATSPFAGSEAQPVARLDPQQAAAINAVQPPVKPVLAHDLAVGDQVQTGALATAQPRVKPLTGPEPTQMMRDLQILMGARGLYRGEVDGLASPGTSDAIKALERSLGLVQTGEASERLLAIARERVIAVPAAPKPAADKPEARAVPVAPVTVPAQPAIAQPVAVPPPVVVEKRAIPAAPAAPVPPMPIGKTAVPVVQPQGKVAIPVVPRPLAQASAQPVAVAKAAPVQARAPAPAQAVAKPQPKAVPVIAQQAQIAPAARKPADTTSIDALIQSAAR
jgi:peptidoglycan hydrolase-like protein with peptidoglycan-binding domain